MTDDRASWIGGHLVVVGASAGGVSAIKQILSAMPDNFPAPIVFVLHQSSKHVTVLDQVLNRRTGLRVACVEDGETMRPGHVYVSVPGRDLVIEGETARLVDCEEEARFCPSINRTLESAAHAFGHKLIAVLLTGMLDDGVAALETVYELGGSTVVQHPGDAEFPSMPIQAILKDHPGHVLPLDAIAGKLFDLASD